MCCLFFPRVSPFPATALFRQGSVTQAIDTINYERASQLRSLYVVRENAISTEYRLTTLLRLRHGHGVSRFFKPRIQTHKEKVTMAGGSEPFPPLSMAANRQFQSTTADSNAPRRRRKSSILGSELRLGDTGAPSIATGIAQLSSTKVCTHGAKRRLQASLCRANGSRSQQ